LAGKCMMLPNIAVTIGDPAGVGPEVTLKALASDEIRGLARWIVVGDESAIRQTEEFTGAHLGPEVEIRSPGLLRGEVVIPGRLSGVCGRAGLEYVRIATEMCLRGEADAMVTAPLNKEAVTMAGQKFSGHTEFIAEICGIEDSRMLLAGERMRVVHVTTHVPLREACKVDGERILRTIELGHEAAVRMGFERPRIAVCGLNPHAGENGLFGNEDGAVIAPAVKAAQERGIACEGPLPSDTVFLKAVRGAYDMVVAMYHDQGHVPMKLWDFERTVNVTLGLPIIRTSVDHGTAFDIAGRNLAGPTNMKAAMQLAVTMALHADRPAHPDLASR
jgi:4-phospho-D-threonate 3-dehydrogenase / 4-phospho-D-erythronate 3-dehydrogenase